MIIKEKEPIIITCNYCGEEVDAFKAVIDDRFKDNVFCTKDCADNKYEKNSD